MASLSYLSREHPKSQCFRVGRRFLVLSECESVVRGFGGAEKAEGWKVMMNGVDGRREQRSTVARRKGMKTCVKNEVAASRELGTAMKEDEE